MGIVELIFNRKKIILIKNKRQQSTTIQLIPWGFSDNLSYIIPTWILILFLNDATVELLKISTALESK